MLDQGLTGLRMNCEVDTVETSRHHHGRCPSTDPICDHAVLVADAYLCLNQNMKNTCFEVSLQLTCIRFLTTLTARRGVFSSSDHGPAADAFFAARMSSPQLNKFYEAELAVFSLPQHQLKMNVKVWTATVLGLLSLEEPTVSLGARLVHGAISEQAPWPSCQYVVDHSKSSQTTRL